MILGMLILIAVALQTIQLWRDHRWREEQRGQWAEAAVWMQTFRREHHDQWEEGREQWALQALVRQQVEARAQEFRRGSGREQLRARLERRRHERQQTADQP